MADFNPASLALALIAGLLSFASPCVLPLVPAYVGYIAGEPMDHRMSQWTRASGFRVAVSTLAFVLGLAVVFTLFGATATAIGRTFVQYQTLLTKISGAAVVLLGLHTIGIVRLPWLHQARGADPGRFRSRGIVGSALMGAAFATGWVPCVGPFLAGLLALASREDTVLAGMLLLFTYALGLGAPFLVIGLACQPAGRWLAALRPRLAMAEALGGLLLVLVGALLFTDQYAVFTTWVTSVMGPGLTI